jgi:hypothetical protein
MSSSRRRHASLGADGRDLANVGSDWVIRMFPRTDVVSIQHLETLHVAELGKDHIYDFRSNPMRSTDGARHGFLVLKVQVFVQGDSARGYRLRWSLTTSALMGGYIGMASPRGGLI